MVEYTGSGEIDLSVLEVPDVIDIDTLKKFLDNFSLGMNCAAVSVDREGNVYQRNKEGNVQQYNGRNWENVNGNNSNQQNVNRQIEQRQRGNTNASAKYQNTQRGGNVGSSYSKQRTTSAPKATAPAARTASPKKQQPAARQSHSNSSTRRAQ